MDTHITIVRGSEGTGKHRPEGLREHTVRIPENGPCKGSVAERAWVPAKEGRGQQ